MKEKLNKAKEWIKEHKKRSAGIVIAMLLIIGTGTISIVGINSVNSNMAADKKTSAETVKGDTDKTSTKAPDADKKESDKKEEDEKASDQEKKQDTAKTEEKSTDTEKPDNVATATSNNGNTGTSSSSSSSSSTGGGSSQKQSHTHSYTIPVYGTEQKWVVDQAAWTETVNEPIYEMKEIAVGNQSGKEIAGDPNEYLLNNSNGDTGWHSEWIQVPVGNNTYTIDHPEQGHWESYSVVTGYQCSCGAVQ